MLIAVFIYIVIYTNDDANAYTTLAMDYTQINTQINTYKPKTDVNVIFVDVSVMGGRDLGAALIYSGVREDLEIF